MIRLRAVRSLLVGDVAGLRVVDATGEAGEARWAEQAARERRALEKARRRAALVATLDAAALLVLFVLRERSTTFLPVGPTEETVFTVGVIAIAAHLGFRLAQMFLYRNVARIYEELTEREE